MTNFWLNDPNILLNKKYITEIWPNSDYDLARKLNAVTRIILLLTILGYFFTKSVKILISAVIALVVLTIIYKTKSNKVTKENFSNNNNNNNNNDESLANYFDKEFTVPTKKNPVMNVLMSEYKYNPKRKEAAPAYNEEISEKINNDAKNQNLKLYRNLGDNLTFENSMRNFYATANTTIPNNQKDFALFCYGNMPSCKDGDGLQCAKNNVSLRTT